MHSEIIFMHMYVNKQTDNNVRVSFYNPPMYAVLLFCFIVCLFVFLNILNFVLPVEDRRCFNRKGQMGVYFTL